jgi:hypothetical protein
MFKAAGVGAVEEWKKTKWMFALSMRQKNLMCQIK